MTGRVVHFEFPFDDEGRALAFYRELFGWEIQSVPGMGYHLVQTGPVGDEGATEPGYIGGGMLGRQAPVTGPILVIDVEDIDAALAQIGAKGGSTVRPKHQVGDMGFAAYFEDPEGNVVGLWETARPPAE